jgi:hypothetical protein
MKGEKIVPGFQDLAAGTAAGLLSGDDSVLCAGSDDFR